jgi:serine/threonine-protein kinase HipA
MRYWPRPGAARAERHATVSDAAFTTSIRYLRMYLHAPGGDASRRRAIGWLSQYGDILRVSFEPGYVDDPARPTLSLAYRGAD